ncbi:uncharacterized protein [Antedon mediterranea]|uniref:uncharacterized protein n=1 Tax=Antedon mediterranea TaxID=105859 RepID=UPI003AF60AB3
MKITLCLVLVLVTISYSYVIKSSRNSDQCGGCINGDCVSVETESGETEYACECTPNARGEIKWTGTYCNKLIMFQDLNYFNPFNKRLLDLLLDVAEERETKKDYDERNYNDYYQFD